MGLITYFCIHLYDYKSSHEHENHQIKFIKMKTRVRGCKKRVPANVIKNNAMIFLKNKQKKQKVFNQTTPKKIQLSDKILKKK